MKTLIVLSLVAIYLVNHVLGGSRSKSDPDDRSIVSTNLGQLRPKKISFSPRKGRREIVYAYLGIPYAEPPVETRRFRPPEPVQPWEDVLSATVNPTPCPQYRAPDYEYSEDCLYLNVYVPKRVPKNAAVMFYIHGGSLKTGSGTDYPTENPAPLAAQGDVIVVTFNYRLNIFGFFTTGDDGIPPNLGLLDQRLALQWVYENIQAFGGDPQKITVFGESAGAVSASWHILSEESRQYFQRAILQSGSPINLWARELSQEDVQQTLGLIDNVAECDISNVADCLKGKSVEELLSIVGKIEELFPTGFIFVPTLDGEFFASDIADLLEAGNYSDIAILIGTNEDEGTYVTFSITGRPEEQPFISKEFFASSLQTSANPLLTDLLEVIYRDGIDDTSNYEGALSAVFGDTWFTCAINDYARQVAEAGSTVYMYRMTHVPKKSIWNSHWLGATHGEDLQYVFGLPFFDDSLRRPSRERRFSFYVIQMWANFAKSGNPTTPGKLPKGFSDWPQFLPNTELYKELDIFPSNEQKLRQHYCNFWDNLVPQLAYLAAATEGASG